MGAVTAGRPGHAGHGDRLASADHRCFFCDQTGDSVGLFAALSGVAHQCQGNRSNLHALCQLGAVCADCAGSVVVQIIQQPGRRLWHCGDAGHADHHGADFFVIRYAWHYPLALCLAATSVFFVVDLAFFSSNLLKLVDGGWFPLLIAAGVFTVMLTWKDGRRLLNKKLAADAIDLTSFLEAVFVSPPTRVAGTAVFLTAAPGTVPNAMLHNLKHNKVLHEVNLFITVVNHEVPWIGMDKRLELETLGHDCWQVVVNYGFKNDPDLPRALQLMKGRGFELEPMSTSYFLSRDTIAPTLSSGMAPWREKLFAQMHLNASGAANFLKLPSNSFFASRRRHTIFKCDWSSDVCSSDLVAFTTNEQHATSTSTAIGSASTDDHHGG